MKKTFENIFRTKKENEEFNINLEESLKRIKRLVHPSENLQKLESKCAFWRFQRLKGCLKSVYSKETSVELQHKAKELW